MSRHPLLVAALPLVLLVAACQEGKDYAETVAGGLDRARQMETRASFQTLAQALEGYQIDHNRYPERLADLPEVSSGRFSAIDPWGNELRYEVSGGSYEILSDGPDGLQGSDDDLALRDGRVE